MYNRLDNHFRLFAASLEQVICGYGEFEGDQTENQKKQVEELVKLEAAFKDALIKDWRGNLLYRKFVSYILDERKNILAARPYFRERQDVFKKEIAPLLRTRQEVGLYKFNINYSFIAFALRNAKTASKSRPFGPKSYVMRAARKVERARKELIELNIPLAISRAKLFKQHTPQSHLEYMDLVQIANEGLIAAVDKFVLPYTPVFRAVIIGRISGNHIEEYSDTLLHFYPSDKRKIYRANKVQGAKGVLPLDDLAKEVNKNNEVSYETSADELHRLLSASSHVSIDTPITDNAKMTETDVSVDHYPAEDSVRPDVQVEEREAYRELYKAIGSLSLLEKKLLLMKGIHL